MTELHIVGMRSREPIRGDIYVLPSSSRVLVDRQLQSDGCFSCRYLDGMELKGGREFAPGVTLTIDFLMARCKREA